jgi:hypothetical protein
VECIESPEQIEDESKASKTSVSACVRGEKGGGKVYACVRKGRYLFLLAWRMRQANEAGAPQRWQPVRVVVQLR